MKFLVLLNILFITYLGQCEINFSSVDEALLKMNNYDGKLDGNVGVFERSELAVAATQYLAKNKVGAEHLVSYIDKIPDENNDNFPFYERMYPCTQALVDYGYESVPYILGGLKTVNKGLKAKLLTIALEKILTKEGALNALYDESENNDQSNNYGKAIKVLKGGKFTEIYKANAEENTIADQKIRSPEPQIKEVVGLNSQDQEKASPEEIKLNSFPWWLVGMLALLATVAFIVRAKTKK